MSDPAAGGALGPELPDLVVLEVGVAEIAQGSATGGRRCARAVPLRGGYRGCPYGATKRPRLVWLLAGRPLMARVASPTRRRCQADGVPTRSRIGR